MRQLTTVIVTGLLLVSHVSAQSVWYEGAITAFVRAGYVAEEDIVPEREAPRAMFVELTLKLLGGKVKFPFLDQVFDDVGQWHPTYAAFQQGARDNWVLGIQNCAGTHPCIAAPDRPVTRAEAAALLVRAFRFDAASAAPAFSDNDPEAWYAEYVTIAASRCILRGDSGKTTVRPGDAMNEAEMLAMLQRSVSALRYPDCNEPVIDELPKAEAGFLLDPQPQPSSSSVSSSSSSFSSSTGAASASSQSSSVSSSALSSASASSPSSLSSTSGAASSLKIFDLTPLSPPAAGSASSGQTQDPHYQDLLIRFQQYLANFSALIAQARATDNLSAVSLLTTLNAQIDLMHQLYPWVVASKSRVLTTAEWATVTVLENRIRGVFAGVQ